MTSRLIAFLRYAPLALAVALAGPLLTVANPGLFWDDWVWFFQSPAEHLKIGRELGIWWAGHLNNAIYALPEPTLTLRITSLLAWIVAGAAAAFTFWRIGLLSRREAFMAWALVAASHVAMVRFLNSVALYNVYIAVFWIGCAILSLNPRSWRYKALSLPFFFFSFHLNSLIAVYAAVLLLLFIDRLAMEPHLRAPPRFRPSELLGGSAFRRWLGATGQRVGLRVLPSFLARNIVLIVLPVVFLLMVKLLRRSSALYESYNSVSSGGAYKGVLRAARELFDVFHDYVFASWRHTSLTYLWIFLLVYAALALLLPRNDRTPTWRSVVFTALVGVLLVYLGLVPYYTVGKPPVLHDYYDSRHILAAVPGLVLIQLAILKALSIPLLPGYGWWARLVRDTVFVAFLALSSNHALVAGYNLLKDFTVQAAIEGFVADNREKLADYKTILFVDRTEGMRLGKRQIWNYEYTGTLVKAFGDKTRLGVTVDEYVRWTPNLPLVTEPAMKTRYNLDDYDPKAPHIVLYMGNSSLRPTFPRMVSLLSGYWRGEPTRQEAMNFITFGTAVEYIEAPRRLREVQEIVGAIQAYKAQNGFYPVSTTNVPPVASPFGLLPALTFSAPALAPADAWKEALAPRFIEKDKLTAVCQVPECGYLYLSDGVDYKLVYRGPQDVPYARQAYGAQMDPRRDAYGYWTPGGALW